MTSLWHDIISARSPVGEITAFGLEILIVSDFLEIFVKGMFLSFFADYSNWKLSTQIFNLNVITPLSFEIISPGTQAHSYESLGKIAAMAAFRALLAYFLAKDYRGGQISE